MVAVPDQLLWELVKGNNCFLKQKNGSTKRSGKITFSVEPGNVQSINKFKYSGIANYKAADVVCTKDNKAQLIRKTASKADKKIAKSAVNVNKDFRRSVNVIEDQAVQNYYRPDLEKDLLAKYTKVYQANRRAKGIVKPVPTKKGRGTN